MFLPLKKASGLPSAQPNGLKPGDVENVALVTRLKDGTPMIIQVLNETWRESPKKSRVGNLC